MSVEVRLAIALESELEQVRPRAGAWARLRSRLEESPPVPLWHRVWDLGLSRRQFLGHAATAAAAALLPVPLVPQMWPLAPAPQGAAGAAAGLGSPVAPGGHDAPPVTATGRPGRPASPR